MSLHFIKIKNACVGITFNEQQITIAKLDEASASFRLFVFTGRLVQCAVGQLPSYSTWQPASPLGSHIHSILAENLYQMFSVLRRGQVCFINMF